MALAIAFSNSTSDWLENMLEDELELTDEFKAKIEPAQFDPGIAPLTGVNHNSRYVRVANASKEKATVFLQYYTQDTSGEWKWYPGEPGSEVQPISFEVDPGEAADVEDSGWQVNASKIRIWGESESGKKWVKFKEADLPVVKETDEKGEPSYIAEEKQTFCFTVK